MRRDSVAQQTAAWLGFHEETAAPSRIIRRARGKLRSRSAIGLGPTFIMTTACYRTVWNDADAGKFAIIDRDGTERLVDGVSMLEG